MNRRRLTIVTACVALGTAAITAWFCVPILQERRYLDLIADKDFSALDDDRKREVFEKLADLCRCNNLDRLVRAAYYGDEAAHEDTEEVDLDLLLAELASENEAIDWRQTAQDSAAEVVRRCQGSFVRLLTSDLEESLRAPAIALAGVMGDDAAFVKPELSRILNDRRVATDARMMAAAAIARMCTAEEWSRDIASMLGSENEREIWTVLLREIDLMGERAHGHVEFDLFALPHPMDGVVQHVATRELVVLSLGPGDQAGRGVEFTVARGNKFIGKVSVLLARGTAAYARILYTKEGQSIRPGDRALTATAIR